MTYSHQISKSIFIFITLSLFLYLNSISSKSSIPLKETIIPLIPHESTLFEINSSTKKVFFFFDNQFEDSDIIINLKIARQYTTRAYFYDDYFKIKTDDQGQYIDFLTKLDLSEKILYIKSSEIKIKKIKYYIVIKDYFNYSTKDYISIYNEQDTIELKNKEPFIVNYFFSKNLYTLKFEAQKNEEIILELNINDIDFNKVISIELNDEIIYKGIRNKGAIKLNEDKNLEGTYKIYISSDDEELYSFIKSSLVLEKKISKVTELTPVKENIFTYSLTKTFSYYVDIDEYDYLEENIITFKFSHNVFKNKLLEFCYAKTLNFAEVNDDKFYSNMPTHEEENEGDFSKLNTIDNIYHLYFRKTKNKEEGKKSYLLVYCSITIDDEMEYFYPEYFSIFLSQRASSIDLTQNEYAKININLNLTLTNFLAQVFKIKIPKAIDGERNYAYVFFTNSKSQTVYENSMLIGTDHKNEVLREIYVLPYDKEISNEYIYIKLFGSFDNINFRIESTKSQIYYLNQDTRPIKTFSKEHLNCGESFYFIGSYSDLAEESRFFLEEIYGNYIIYYKNEITASDEDAILTNENEKYLVKTKFGILNNTFDILELKCDSPGYFNFHILKNI